PAAHRPLLEQVVAGHVVEELADAVGHQAEDEGVGPSAVVRGEHDAGPGLDGGPQGFEALEVEAVQAVRLAEVLRHEWPRDPAPERPPVRRDKPVRLDEVAFHGASQLRTSGGWGDVSTDTSDNPTDSGMGIQGEAPRARAASRH